MIVIHFIDGDDVVSKIAGNLKEIELRTRTFHGQNSLYWYIHIEEPKSELVYSLGFNYQDNLFKSIVLSLASVKRFANGDIIELIPYLSNGYCKCITKLNGGSLAWITDKLPAIEEVKDSAGIVVGKSDAKRMRLIQECVMLINDRLKEVE